MDQPIDISVEEVKASPIEPLLTEHNGMRIRSSFIKSTKKNSVHTESVDPMNKLEQLIMQVDNKISENKP